MVKKIDDTTLVPLTWLAALLLTTISCTSIVVFWVLRVDTRLNRIEQKLGIYQPDEAQTTMINSAMGQTK